MLKKITAATTAELINKINTITEDRWTVKESFSRFVAFVFSRIRGKWGVMSGRSPPITPHTPIF
jgi:hypothetical protein